MAQTGLGLTNERATRQFYDLVWPHRAAVLRLALILSGNDAEADDLAQETLMKAFRGLDSLRDETDVRAWLLTILRHTRVDCIRAAAAHPEVSLENLATEPTAAEGDETQPAENPQALLEAFSDRQVIVALQRLPEEIRWSLLLVEVEGLSLEDAARLLEVPTGTIKSRLHRGRAMLKETLLPVARDRRLVSE
jgi:RNA polymerase sigma-70 factor (ECF subfamily)